jgi:hypothetical protein
MPNGGFRTCFSKEHFCSVFVNYDQELQDFWAEYENGRPVKP